MATRKKYVQLITRRRFVKISAASVASTSLFMLGCSKSSQQTDESDSRSARDASEQKEQQSPSSSTSTPMNRKYVYVTEYAGNTLAAVDFENQTIATRYPAGQNPITAVEGDSVLYVGNSSGGKLQAFSIDTGLNTPIAAGQQPLGLVIDEDSQILYACDYFSSAIQIIDTKLGSMTSSIPLSDVGFMGRTDPPACCRTTPGAGRRPVCMAKSSDGILYCANYGTYDIARIDLSSGEEIEPFDGVVGPRTMLLSKDESSILLAGVGGESEERVFDLYVIDRKTGTRFATIPIGEGVVDVCMNSTGNKAFAIARDEGTLVEIDTVSWQELRRTQLGIGIGAICLSNDDLTLYVANAETGELLAVDVESLETIFRVSGLSNPKDIAVLRG